MTALCTHDDTHLATHTFFCSKGYKKKRVYVLVCTTVSTDDNNDITSNKKQKV